jgi:hypothetical protein
MPLTTPEIISGLALLLAILSAVWQRFGVIIDIKKDQSTLAFNFQKELGECKTKCSNTLATLKDSVLGQLGTQVDSLYGQFDKLSGQLVVIDNRTTKQEMKMDLFWGAVQETVKDMIKQPIHFRKDDLLDRFPNLEYKEMYELKTSLQIEKKEMSSNIKSLTPAKKTYLLALVLMLAGIDSRLIDMDGGQG